MGTLDIFAKKFNIDLNQPSPIYIPIGRYKNIPALFRDLNFKVGAEIGVYRGTYSRILLSRVPGLKLYCVDRWEPYEGYKDFDMFPKTDLSDAYLEAKEVTKDYDCELIRGWSHEVVNQFEDGSLDFVFIDGNHAYEYVVQDIANWSKKVRKDGIIYGHDYDDWSRRGRWAEMNVINAVMGWTKSYKISPWFVITNNSNNCWMYVK